MLPAAVNDIVIAFILKNEWVDRLRAVVDITNKRMSQQILKRPSGIVGYCHAYAANFLLIVVNIIRREKEIVLTTHFGNRRRPHGFVRPFYGSGIQDITVFC